MPPGPFPPESIEALAARTGWHVEFLEWLVAFGEPLDPAQRQFAEDLAYAFYRTLQAELYAQLFERIVGLIGLMQSGVAPASPEEWVRRAKLLAHEALLPAAAGEELLRDLLKMGVQAARETARS